jgi:cell division septal protein FtsQ
VAAGRLSRPGWKLLAGALVAALAWFGGPRLLRRLDFFRIRQIEVRGQVNLTPAEVARAVAPPAGMSLFDDLAGLQARAESLPGVREATVGRRLPATLVVTVREAVPVALVQRHGYLQLVSEQGAVLPFDPTTAAPDLPVIEAADSLVTGLLARVRDADATLFAGVVSAARSGDDVLLLAGRRRYLFRPDAPAEVIRVVTVVAQDLERRGRPWTELDARFAGQVVVRREAA